MEIITIPLAAIVINPEYQALFPPLSEEEYATLEDDIKHNGIHTPLIVRYNPKNGHGSAPAFECLDGHHRYKIAQALGFPFVLGAIAKTAAEIISGLFNNIHRRQLDQASLKLLRSRERRMRQQIHDRLIPRLQQVFHLLPQELQGSLAMATEETQEQFVTELQSAVHGTKLLPGKTAIKPSPAAPNQHAKIQQLTTQLSELEQIHEEDRKASITQHNALTRDLQSAQTECALLKDQIAAMRQEVVTAKAEMNAARIVADERLGSLNANTTPTPQILLHGLEYLDQLATTLAVYASKLPTLAKRELAAAHTHLQHIHTHVSQLEEALQPPHDLHVTQTPRNGKPSPKPSNLSLVQSAD